MSPSSPCPASSRSAARSCSAWRCSGNRPRARPPRPSRTERLTPPSLQAYMTLTSVPVLAHVCDVSAHRGRLSVKTSVTVHGRVIAGWAADFRGWVDGLAGMGNSLSPRKRELLLSFSPATAGMSVVDFCRLQGVSTTTFYRLRERAAAEGVDAALVPRSRAPLNPARVYDGLLDDVIIAIHQQLEDEGKDAGPWSVWWRMEWDNYKTVPSRSTIARRMRALGLSKPSPRKRPKSSWKRFVRGCC